MSDYTDRVDRMLDGLGFISTGPLCGPCGECNETWDHDGPDTPEDQPDDSGGISRQPCDACGTTLQGERYAAHARDENDEIVHLDVCSDCVQWIELGEEPNDWP